MFALGQGHCNRDETSVGVLGDSGSATSSGRGLLLGARGLQGVASGHYGLGQLPIQGGGGLRLKMRTGISGLHSPYLKQRFPNSKGKRST